MANKKLSKTDPYKDAAERNAMLDRWHDALIRSVKAKQSGDPSEPEAYAAWKKISEQYHYQFDR